jgi:hypothetical protein
MMCSRKEDGFICANLEHGSSDECLESYKGGCIDHEQACPLCDNGGKCMFYVSLNSWTPYT